MILLYAYIITTGISISTLLLYSKIFEIRIKKEGYIYKKKKKSLSDRLLENAYILLKLLVPIVNIANTLAIVFKGDEIYKKMKEEMILEGKIYKPKEEIIDVEVLKCEDVNKDMIQNKEEKNNEYVNDSLYYEDEFQEENNGNLKPNGPSLKRTRRY